MQINLDIPANTTLTDRWWFYRKTSGQQRSREISGHGNLSQ